MSVRTLLNRVDTARREFLRKILLGSGAAMLGRNALAAQDAKVLTRPIPSSGEALPGVGVGTWQAFDIGRSAEQLASRLAVLEILLRHGGSVIDSSPMYGSAESVVGELLEKMGAHDRAFLATKVWTRGEGFGIAQMQDSLRKLRTEKIELMQIHNLLDWQTHLKTLRKWKENGTIRYLGITHYQASGYPEMMRIMRHEPLDFIQLNYSILSREAEREILPLAADKGIAVLTNRPYDGGGLFSHIRGADLPGWARDIDCHSWGQFALKYILSHPAVTCVIPGTGSPEHMEDNMGAGLGRLPDPETRRRMVTLIEGL